MSAIYVDEFVTFFVKVYKFVNSNLNNLRKLKKTLLKILFPVVSVNYLSKLYDGTILQN